jgi:hypothetical protein
MTVNYSISNVKQPSPVDSPAVPDEPPAVVIGRLEKLLIRVVAAEFLVIAGTCYMTSVIYNEAALSRWPPTERYVPAALAIALLVLLSALGFKHYVRVQAQSRDFFMWSGIGAVALAFSLFLSLLFVFKIADWYSRGTFFFQFFGAAAAMLIVRGTMHARIRKAIHSGAVEARRAVLIGDGNADAEILASLKQSGIRAVGDLPFPYVHGNTIPGVGAFSHTIRKLVERCRSYRPDDIIFLATPADLPRIAAVADALSELPVTIHIIPMGAGELWASSKITNYGGTVTIQVLHPPLSVVDLAAKRAFDICASGLGLLVLSPLLLMAALAIRLDSRGPVCFRQTRHGYNNDAIRVLKFRTMTTTEDGHQCKQAVKDDPRITRIGRMGLRRGSEIGSSLPQTFQQRMKQIPPAQVKPSVVKLCILASRTETIGRRGRSAAGAPENSGSNREGGAP